MGFLDAREMAAEGAALLVDAADNEDGRDESCFRTLENDCVIEVTGTDSENERLLFVDTGESLEVTHIGAGTAGLYDIAIGGGVGQSGSGGTAALTSCLDAVRSTFQMMKAPQSVVLA